MTLLQRITINPNICHGKPTIRGSRIMVATLLELLSSGMTYEEMMEDYPNLVIEDIYASLHYAMRLTNFKTFQLEKA